MSTKTTNFEFIKPELTDTADITQYNENWDKVDTKFKEIETNFEGVSKNVTPESIGAAKEDHTHTAAEVGAATSDHTHTPESIGAAKSDHTHSPDSIGAAKKDLSNVDSNVIVQKIQDSGVDLSDSPSTEKFNQHVSNTTVHVTAEEKAKWNNVDFSAMEEQIANKAPMYTYGTADLTAGVTPLETGKLHFVYE